MSYAKLWKVCQDAALGIAGVNAAKGNLEVFRDAWSAEHGTNQPVSVAGGPISLGDPYNGLGAHNTPHVPRAVVLVTLTDSAGATVVSVPEIGGGIVRSVSKIGTGAWHITLDERLSLFFGDPRPIQADNTVTRACQPYGYVFGTVAPGLIVNTYELQAGFFTPADYDFSCAIYSYS